MAKSNPFDAIAKPKAESKAKSSKVAAVVTDAVKQAVDVYIRIKAEIARLEAEQKAAAAVIIDAVRPQQDDLAYKGQYSKSFEVAGTTGAVTYTTSDRFSVPKDEATQAAIKECVGKYFDEFFSNRRTITLKAAAAENQELIGKLMKAIAAAGMEVGDVFEVVDALAANSDLDRNQYKLVAAKLAEFRTLCKQYSPAIK